MAGHHQVAQLAGQGRARPVAGTSIDVGQGHALLEVGLEAEAGDGDGAQDHLRAGSIGVGQGVGDG